MSLTEALTQGLHWVPVVVQWSTRIGWMQKSNLCLCGLWSHLYLLLFFKSLEKHFPHCAKLNKAKLIYWKHCRSFGLICGNRLICSSSDGVAPFKMSLVCVCACPNSESCFPWKEPPRVKHSHTCPPSNAGSVNYQTLLWGITVNHCKTGGVLLGCLSW